MVKIAKAVSEKKTFKNYTFLYIFNPGASTDNSQGTKFEYNKCFTTLITYCKFQPLVFNTF